MKNVKIIDSKTADSVKKSANTDVDLSYVLSSESLSRMNFGSAGIFSYYSSIFSQQFTNIMALFLNTTLGVCIYFLFYFSKQFISLYDYSLFIIYLSVEHYSL